ncbi:hypothetical protein D3C72_2350240 [compost metagenome]
MLDVVVSDLLFPLFYEWYENGNLLKFLYLLGVHIPDGGYLDIDRPFDPSASGLLHASVILE